MSQNKYKFTINLMASIFALVFALFSALSGELSASIPQSNSVDGLYISGQYLYKGEPPAEMKDVFSISLISGKGRNARITGYVTAARRYNFLTAKLTGNRLTFTTQLIADINYKFDGRILKLKAEQGDYFYPELEGTLTKFRNGEKAGEITGKFEYEEFAD